MWLASSWAVSPWAKTQPPEKNKKKAKYSDLKLIERERITPSQYI
jgi:hypothetical protein